MFDYFARKKTTSQKKFLCPPIFRHSCENKYHENIYHHKVTVPTKKRCFKVYSNNIVTAGHKYIEIQIMNIIILCFDGSTVRDLRCMYFRLYAFNVIKLQHSCDWSPCMPYYLQGITNITCAGMNCNWFAFSFWSNEVFAACIHHLLFYCFM